MKTIAAMSACALLALAAPAFAQNAANSAAMKKELRDNGSPSGVSPSHADQPGDRGAESGRAPKVNEGRTSATDSNPGNVK